MIKVQPTTHESVESESEELREQHPAKTPVDRILRRLSRMELLNAAMRLECLQQLLGHQDIEVTRRYARLTDRTREQEYFRATAIIEKGGMHGNYRAGPVPESFEEKKLLGPHSEELREQPRSLYEMAYRTPFRGDPQGYRSVRR
jgi:hypothetical protein